MNLRQAITEQWFERFRRDRSYADAQTKKVENCKTTDDLLYHCMNIDMDGHAMIANKLKMTERDFAFFLSSYRALDQNNFYKGSNGFPYKEEKIERGDYYTIKTTYPDETVVEMDFTRS